MFKSTIYIDKDVNRDSVCKFMEDCRKTKTDVHSLKVICGGETKVRVALAPYSFEYKQQLYSLSKSFTSTAIGFLVDAGKISVEDRMVDLFPEKCPEVIGENLSKMRLKHVLSMNTGHKECILGGIRNDKDPVRRFFEHEPEFEPGTNFCYNNAATYMLSQIVTKYTGMTMYEFLNFKLFKPLGIENTYWNTFANGCSQGAVGFHASTDDIAKLGLLYLNGGVFDGKRILSENWVKEATTPHSDNSTNGTPDWTAGYGYQFWLNGREGFRGDGAFGQLCVVLPEKDMVLAMEVYSEDMQGEMNLVFELADNLFGESSMSESDFEKFAESYNMPASYTPGDLSTSIYRLEKNLYGMNFIQFSQDEKCIYLNFSDGRSWQKMSFGKGEFKENKIFIKKLKPTLEGLMGHDNVEDVHFAGWCNFEDGTLHLHINYSDNPHTDDYVCTFNGDDFVMHKAQDTEFCYDGKILGKIFNTEDIL